MDVPSAKRARTSPSEDEHTGSEGMVELRGEPQHSSLVKLWRNQSLCDTTLLSSGRCWKVHKVVLASTSDYFSALFCGPTSQMSGGALSHTLDVINPQTLDALLCFLYTGKCSVDADELVPLLEAA